MNKFFIACMVLLLGAASAHAAIKFDGIDDSATFTTISLTTYTISFWVLMTSSGAARQMFADDNGSASGAKFGISAAGALAFRAISGGSADISQSQPPINKWTHIALTRGLASKVDYYKNGGSAIRLFSDASQVGALRLTFLGTTSDSNQFWGGQIDDFRVYNRVLSASEIESLGKSRERLMITDGLLTQWPMDQGNDLAVVVGASIKDITGNGHTATGSGGLLWAASTAINYP